MSSGPALLLVLAALAAAGALSAHDGERHDEAADTPPALLGDAGLERPLRLADGSLRVTAAMQRRLGLDTRPWPLTPAAGIAAPLHLAAEAVSRPDAALALVAVERGRIEAPDGGWTLLAGRRVAAGEILAWLRPQLGQAERAERQARLARLDAELAIVDVNVERQKLTRAAVEADGAPTGNIWAEKYLADRDSLRARRDLLAQSLDDRIALRAPRAGRVLAVAAEPGAVVEAGALLARLSDAAALQWVAIHQQAGLGAAIASARLADGTPLAVAGEEPLADGSGWRLRLDPAAAASPARVAGQVSRLMLDLRPAPGQVALPPGTCIRRGDRAEVWVQRGPERFEALPLPACGGDPLPTAALRAGDRLVTAGGALLGLYR
jgi:cobalt-zinc-cadmium efflux system membrane fusion protein